jgi:hypothetical protein
MNDISVKHGNFNNLGYILVDIPNELKQILLEESDEIQENFTKAIPRQSDLAGHMAHEYTLVKCQPMLENFVIQLTINYDQDYHNLDLIDYCTDSVPLIMKNPWINYQSKYEFNPVHNHKGVMSFVAWLKIPYDLETEFEQGPGKLRGKGRQLNSTFTFLYVGASGQIATHTINVDKSYEGKMILFPAKLMHCVYPFYTSDDYRISVSGNVMLDTSGIVK